MGDYQIKFTLCRLAAIAISKHLWKYSFLKDALESCIDWDEECETESPESTMTVVLHDVLNEFVVPEAAIEELHFAIGTMGREIWDLSETLRDTYFSSSLADDASTFRLSNFMDYIYWRTDGCLDSCEIIRLSYVSEILPDNWATWVLLCTQCLQDCIIDFWPKREGMDNESHLIYWPGNARHAAFDTILLAYWHARMRNDVENAINVVFRQLPDQLYDDGYSLEENMFMNSFVQNRYWAVKYFWTLFSENQKKRTIVKICERIMSDDPTTQKYKDFFFTNQGAVGHLYMFFLQQLSRYNLDAVKIKILSSGFVLLQLLEWPYDNLFFEALKESLIHHDSIDYGPIISRIFTNICECDKYQFLFGDVKYRRFFYRIWEMNPKNLKTSVDYGKGLTMMWQSQNLDLIGYILRDPDLKNKRKEFLNVIGRAYGSKPDNKLMKKFMEKILVSDEEREFFKCQIVSEITEDAEDMDEDE